MFAIGIGDKIKQEELEGIASPPDNGMSFVLHAEGLDALPALLSQLLPSTCEAIIGQCTHWGGEGPNEALLII